MHGAWVGNSFSHPLQPSSTLWGRPLWLFQFVTLLLIWKPHFQKWVIYQAWLCLWFQNRIIYSILKQSVNQVWVRYVFWLFVLKSNNNNTVQISRSPSISGEGQVPTNHSMENAWMGLFFLFFQSQPPLRIWVSSGKLAVVLLQLAASFVVTFPLYLSFHDISILSTLNGKQIYQPP